MTFLAETNAIIVIFITVVRHASHFMSIDILF